MQVTPVASRPAASRERFSRVLTLAPSPGQVMLVEDCEMQLGTLGVLATACGYKHVVKATSGEQALEMINCGAVGCRWS